MEKTAAAGSAGGKDRGGIGRALDARFHISERGSTVGTEIRGGFGAFAVAVCSLLVSTRIIGQYYGNYAGAYFATALVSLLATAAVGIFANLPVMQTASFSLSTLMVTYLGANSGLTWANILAVSFISSIVCLVILLTPLKKLFLKAVPEGIRKALPVGIGLYVIFFGLKDAGILSSDGSIASLSDLDDMGKVYFWIMLAGVLLLVTYIGFNRQNALGSTFGMMIAAMWVIGIVFFMEDFVGGQTATTLVYQRVNLIFATDGAAPYTISAGAAGLNAGLLFREGFDFSQFTDAGGNAALFLLQSITTFVLMALYTGTGVVQAASDAGEPVSSVESPFEKQTTKVLVISSIANLLGSVLGAAPQTIAPESAMETKDGAKTGLASLTASIGFLIALFNWVFFAIMATSTNGVGMWINNTETKLTAYVQDEFAFSGMMLAFIGGFMMKGIRKVNFTDMEEVIPFAVTVVSCAASGNVIYALAFGLAAFVILKLIGSDRKNLAILTVILAVILAAYTILSIKYGGNFITVRQMMGPGGMGPGGPPA